MGRSSCRVLPLLWTSVCAASLLACLVDARPTIQLRTKPHHRSSRNTTTVAFQARLLDLRVCTMHILIKAIAYMC